jgi:hypothetical protein
VTIREQPSESWPHRPWIEFPAVFASHYLSIYRSSLPLPAPTECFRIALSNRLAKPLIHNIMSLTQPECKRASRIHIGWVLLHPLSKMCSALHTRVQFHQGIHQTQCRVLLRLSGLLWHVCRSGVEERPRCTTQLLAIQRTSSVFLLLLRLAFVVVVVLLF